MDSSTLDPSSLTHPTVNTKTREILRRETATFLSQPNGEGNGSGTGTGNGTGNGNGNGSSAPHQYFRFDDMDPESRPLLERHVPTNLHPDPGFWRHLLIHTQSTPGTNSPNPFVRWPARVWNVTKVTLFSCMFWSDEHCGRHV